MRVHDGTRDGQSQPHAVALGGKERFEYAREPVRRDTATGVGAPPLRLCAMPTNTRNANSTDRSIRCFDRSTRLISSDSHLADENRTDPHSPAYVDVVADRRDVVVHVLEIARDGDLVHREGLHAVLHPITRRAARVVAGHTVHALPHEL